MQRVLTILIALDHLVFALITLGNCKRWETISGASYALYKNGKLQGKIFCPTIDFIFSLWEKDHCKTSWEIEQRLHSFLR